MHALARSTVHKWDEGEQRRELERELAAEERARLEVAHSMSNALYPSKSDDGPARHVRTGGGEDGRGLAATGGGGPPQVGPRHHDPPPPPPCSVYAPSKAKDIGGRGLRRFFHFIPFSNRREEAAAAEGSEEGARKRKVDEEGDQGGEAPVSKRARAEG